MRRLVFPFALLIISACSHVLPPKSVPEPACSAPDSAGMSLRLVQRFMRMARDTAESSFLSTHGIAPEQVREPTLVTSTTDAELCTRLVAQFGTNKPDAPEGGAYFRSGPYIFYAPWRNYARRNEWTTRNSEWVGFVVFDANLRPLVGIAM
jgi:hypothetical protein